MTWIKRYWELSRNEYLWHLGLRSHNGDLKNRANSYSIDITAGFSTHIVTYLSASTVTSTMIDVLVNWRATKTPQAITVWGAPSNSKHFEHRLHFTRSLEFIHWISESQYILYWKLYCYFCYQFNHMAWNCLNKIHFQIHVYRHQCV